MCVFGEGRVQVFLSFSCNRTVHSKRSIYLVLSYHSVCLHLFSFLVVSKIYESASFWDLLSVCGFLYFYYSFCGQETNKKKSESINLIDLTDWIRNIDNLSPHYLDCCSYTNIYRTWFYFISLSILSVLIKPQLNWTINTQFFLEMYPSEPLRTKQKIACLFFRVKKTQKYSPIVCLISVLRCQIGRKIGWMCFELSLLNGGKTNQIADLYTLRCFVWFYSATCARCVSAPRTESIWNEEKSRVASSFKDSVSSNRRTFVLKNVCVWIDRVSNKFVLFADCCAPFDPSRCFTFDNLLGSSLNSVKV